jgi:hypothetical protein
METTNKFTNIASAICVPICTAMQSSQTFSSQEIDASKIARKSTRILEKKPSKIVKALIKTSGNYIKL